MNAGVKSENVYNCEGVVTCSNVYYSRFLEYCSYCLGCIGLKNKQFCIFNKQYTKEERFELADKIFAKMDEEGTLGKYFPASLNPFYFNDTMASLVGDFTEEEIKQKEKEEGKIVKENIKQVSTLKTGIAKVTSVEVKQTVKPSYKRTKYSDKK